MIEFNIQKSLIPKIIILSLSCLIISCAAYKSKKCGCPTFGDKKKKKRSDLLYNVPLSNVENSIYWSQIYGNIV